MPVNFLANNHQILFLSFSYLITTVMREVFIYYLCLGLYMKWGIVAQFYRKNKYVQLTGI